MNEPLTSWNDGEVKAAILDFVRRVTASGSPDFVPVEERVAVFDNDGTLWCEKPMPVELGFILARMARMASADPSLRARQPWRAAFEQDHAWLGGAITKHYHGDDTDVNVLMEGLLEAFAGMNVDEYQVAASTFLQDARHPTLGRPYTSLGYRPMVELVRYLDENGFATFIASGGSRDFMRTVTLSMYGVPPERIVGSSNALEYQEEGGRGELVFRARPEVFDDGPIKPVRIWSRTGRRPIIAAGNSNGDIPMLAYASHPSRRSLGILVRHDDADREFAYDAGAEQALDRAATDGWTVVSITHDWATVFA